MNIGYAFLAAFALCVPVANWMIGNIGTTCIPDGPCLIPVAPGLMAPSGVLMIGLALVLRDLVQRALGWQWAVAAILVGGVLSWWVAPPMLVVASVTAFLLSEMLDLSVYTPLQRNHFMWAIVLSSTVGLVADSVVFLYLAFGSLDHLAGQIVGKAWMVGAAAAAIWMVRRAQSHRMLEG